MLVYNNCNSYINKEAIKVVLGALSEVLLGNGAELLWRIILENCNLAYERFFVGHSFAGHWVQEIIVLPRSESALDRLILNWHKLLDSLCEPRAYQLTEEQAEISKELEFLHYSTISHPLTLLKRFIVAEIQNQIKPQTQGMEYYLKSFELEDERNKLETSLKIQSLEEKINQLEPPEEDKIFPEKYRRIFKRKKFGVKGFRNSPYIAIDIIPYLEFISQIEKYRCWAVQAKKGIPILKHTHKPQKHNKPMVFL